MDVDTDDHDGKRHVVAGVTDRFKIHAKDAFGNKCDSGGLGLTADCTGTDKVPVKVIDNGDGGYTVEYTPFKSGPYTLTIKAPDGNKIGGAKNPLGIIVSPASADGKHSVAKGPGIEEGHIGKDNQFTIQARDAFGNDIKNGGAPIGGAIVAPDGTSVPIKAKDNGDGTYLCSYPSIAKSGPHLLTPTLAGSPIKDAPFKINVNSGDTDPNKTAVKVRPGVGMDVELRDNHGNKRVKTQKDTVVCEAKPLTSHNLKATRNEDGTFAVHWPGHFAGDYEAKVLVNGAPAPGGPWKSTVTQPPVSQQHQAAIAQHLPQVSSLMSRLLLHATPAERDRIVAALGGGDGGSSSHSNSNSDSGSDSD